MRFLFIATLAFLLMLSGWGCSLGPITASNDQAPNGTIVAQGSFVSVASGVEVVGTATVYDQTGGAYIVRIALSKAPNESNMTLIAVIDGNRQSGLMLRSRSGSVNYNYTYSGNSLSPSWDKVIIRSAVNSRDYAEAIF